VKLSGVWSSNWVKNQNEEIYIVARCRFQRFNDHFGMFVSTGRAVNPITHSNWEGTGVQPDVKVSANRAVLSAHLAAMQKVLVKTTEPEFIDELKKSIKKVQKELTEFSAKG
jgi:hypothetical protein